MTSSGSKQDCTEVWNRVVSVSVAPSFVAPYCSVCHATLVLLCFFSLPPSPSTPVFSLHSFRLWVPKQMHVPGPMTPSSSLKSQSALSFIFLLYTAACKDHTDSIVTFFGSNGDHSARRM